MRKPCSVCGVKKSLGEFQKRARSADGRTAACRTCLQLRDAKRYPKERKYRLAQHRIYMQTADGKNSHARSAIEWRERNIVKRAAHILLGNALRDGKIEKGPCEVCGDRDVHGHHDDYTKPMKVRWLCPTHHRQHHKETAKART